MLLGPPDAAGASRRRVLGCRHRRLPGPMEARETHGKALVGEGCSQNRGAGSRGYCTPRRMSPGSRPSGVPCSGVMILGDCLDTSSPWLSVQGRGHRTGLFVFCRGRWAPGGAEREMTPPEEKQGPLGSLNLKPATAAPHPFGKISNESLESRDQETQDAGGGGRGMGESAEPWGRPFPAQVPVTSAGRVFYLGALAAWLKFRWWSHTEW